MTSLSARKLSGECPFWLDGAFGLKEDAHGMYLCARRRYRELPRHFIQFHKLTLSNVKKICQALENDKDPSKEILFQSNELVIDQTNQFQCPFSKYNNQSPKMENSIVRPCRTIKPKLPHTLCYHLVRDHGMARSDAKNLMYKIRINGQTLT